LICLLCFSLQACRSSTDLRANCRWLKCNNDIEVGVGAIGKTTDVVIKRGKKDVLAVFMTSNSMDLVAITYANGEIIRTNDRNGDGVPEDRMYTAEGKMKRLEVYVNGSMQEATRKGNSWWLGANRVVLGKDGFWRIE